MKKYEKPLCEDIELTVDENIAGGCSQVFVGERNSLTAGCILDNAHTINNS